MQSSPLTLPRKPRAQRGIALIVVMVILLLGTIVVLSSTRTSWLNEIQVGNESDYQRAYAAAEALIRDAEADIQGRLPGGAAINPGNAAYFEDSGRPVGTAVFPIDDNDLDGTVNYIAAAPASAALPCRQGICVPAAPSGVGSMGAWWDVPASLALMKANAATYRDFTTPAPVPVPKPPADNPLLNGFGWYWVEVFRYDGTAPPLRMPEPDTSATGQPFFFRITALVQGRKPGTRVILRTVFVPKPKSAAS